MATLKFPHVNTFYDSRGKLRHVFRRKGHKRITLKGRPGDQDFMQHYHALLESTGTALSEIGAKPRRRGHRRSCGDHLPQARRLHTRSLQSHAGHMAADPVRLKPARSFVTRLTG